MLKRKLRNIRLAASAVRATWKDEPSFRIQLIISIVIGALAAYLNISSIEWVLLILACAGVLTTELINTALERAGNAFGRQNDPQIGLIKDLGAAASCVVGTGTIIVVAIIFTPYITTIF